MVTSFYYQQTIEEPSRITKTSNTLIDNIFAKNCKYWNNKNVNTLLSDHNAQFITIECAKFHDEKHFVEKRIFTEAKMQQLFHKLQDVSWHNIVTEEDPDRAYNRFSEVLDMHIRLLFPKKKFYEKKPAATWITIGIRTSSARKRVIWEEPQKGKVTSEYYKRYSNILKHVVEQAKLMSNRIYIHTAENKMKATWNLVNQITKRDKNLNYSILDNFTTKDETDVLDELNSYFMKVGAKNNIKLDTKHMKPCLQSIFLSPVVEPEVYGYIIRLKNKNSVGIDGIPVRLLKICASLIVVPLTHIMNQILITGKYPQKMKEALVKPLYKKGNKASFENYRPVSLLSNINKIFERIIFDKFIQFFEKNQILVKQQYGFRKGKSTINAIYQTLTNIIKSLNQNQVTATLCLDLSKAFDRVQHDILLLKLEKTGIRGTALELIRSYLTGRTQRISSRGKDGHIKTSKSCNIEVGVPQGSLMGPLLYIIYTNDLVLTTNSDMVMFADDTSITCKEANASICERVLQCDLERLVEWFNMNQLIVNFEKTKLIIFRQKNENIELCHQGKQIEVVKSLSFLGVQIDQNLNWKDHIEKLAPNIAQQCYAVKLIRKMVGLDAALAVYHSYVQSKIR